MLLAIDVGTTNVALGLYLGEELLRTWRIATDRDGTADDLGAIVSSLFMHAELSLGSVQAAAVSNVVPGLGPTLRRFCESYLGCPGDFVGDTLQPAMPVRYDPPSAVGSDRLVDAVAAFRRYGGPVVVMDFGTATTVDAVSREGVFLGGAIAPGIEPSMEGLLQAARHLPRVPVARPRRLIGGSTVESLQSGVYYGFLCQAEGLARRFRRALGPGTRVVATGGLAPVIAAASRQVDHLEPNLTLEGLRILWVEQQCGH
jgi:type III pantothenate kinase